MIEEILSEHFQIPCDLCNEYFNKNGDCPENFTTCNSVEHWKLLMERIQRNEKKNK